MNEKWLIYDRVGMGWVDFTGKTNVGDEQEAGHWGSAVQAEMVADAYARGTDIGDGYFIYPSPDSHHALTDRIAELEGLADKANDLLRESLNKQRQLQMDLDVAKLQVESLSLDRVEGPHLTVYATDGKFCVDEDGDDGGGSGTTFDKAIDAGKEVTSWLLTQWAATCAETASDVPLKDRIREQVATEDFREIFWQCLVNLFKHGATREQIAAIGPAALALFDRAAWDKLIDDNIDFPRGIDVLDGRVSSQEWLNYYCRRHKVPESSRAYSLLQNFSHLVNGRLYLQRGVAYAFERLTVDATYHHRTCELLHPLHALVEDELQHRLSALEGVWGEAARFLADYRQRYADLAAGR